MGCSGLLGLSLDHHRDTLLLSFLLQLFIGLHTSQEVLAALGVVDVFNTNVDPRKQIDVLCPIYHKMVEWVLVLPLRKNLSSDLLVHNDANSMLSYIEDSTSLTMVVLKGHALLEGSITLDINDVSFPVHLKEGR